VEDLDMTHPAAAAYSGRTVLVTGHTGFKGSWLCRWLDRLGARVVGFALPPNQAPNLFEVARIADDTQSVLGDIRDVDALTGVVQTHRPELVFHLAAQALVRRSYHDPIETYATNVMGTVHLLEACRHADSVRAVVIVTSDKCYENREWYWGYREIDRMGGYDPYSSSKGCSEIITAAYRRSFFARASVGLASARAGNVIGGGDWSEDRLIPDLVRGAASGTKVLIRNPSAVRPWQHVLEPLWGYLLVMARLVEQPEAFSEAYNFGPESESVLTVGDVAESFVTKLGRGELDLRGDASGPHEARFLQLDASKARTQLGWRPRLRIAEALDLTAAWYRAHFREAPSGRRVLDDQIEQYMGLVG
jgi:CDP-glucose 4,6-dehydratase